MWSEWKDHAQGNCPVNPVALVRVKMGNGDVLSPLLAMDIDWDFAGDPVVKYQVREVGEAMEIASHSYA